MGLAERNPPQSGVEASPEFEVEFLGISYVRVRQVVSALERAGSSVVLVGEPGCGKSYLAQAAAYEIERTSGSSAKFLIVNDVQESLERYARSNEFGAHELSKLVLQDLQMRANGREIIVIAFNIDRYPPAETAMLEQLVRTRSVRVIATAEHVVGAADRLVRDPRVQRIATEPLTLDESEMLLAEVFGVDRVSQQPLQRWHRSTRGNPHALMTLALSAIRRGIVQRVRKTAWISARDEQAPVDLINQLGELTRVEIETLELVAYATPMHEPALYQLLDAESVTTLMDRQVLTVSNLDTGVSALTTRLPILTDALNTHISPVRRTELAQACYQALLNDDSTLTISAKLRLVRFGMEAGGELPPHWSWQAMRATSRSGNLRFILRVALAAIHHKVAEQSAEAMLRAADLGHFLGDAVSLDEALVAINQLFLDRERFESLSFDLQFRLAMSSICFNPSIFGHPDLALQEFARWENWWSQRNIDGSEYTRVCRMRVLALNGHLREALELSQSLPSARDLNKEWLMAPARTLMSLMHTQRGEFEHALQIAEATRRIVMLHEISPSISGDLEGFAIFFAQWGRGATVAAREVLISLTGPLREDIEAIHSQTGLVDLAIALFAMQEGRWHDTSEVAQRLLDSLAINDPLGVMSFAQAINALALAALGCDEQAHEALLSSERVTPGISSVLQGYVAMTRLRAKHWLRDSRLEEQALMLAEWARSEQAPLIELKALDLVAHQTGQLKPEMLERANTLAEQIDAPIGRTLMAHMQSLVGSNPAAPDPDERLLSEIGIWMPLPPVRELTGREREIALFTALGYPSKHVAERLHLSARTIETHLAHVYAKLGVEGREGLRRWFAQQREAR